MLPIAQAGAMGAGKGYAIDRLVEAGRFPLTGFVAVDPDEVRRQLPEFALYASVAPKKAGELTHKESGYVAEILTAAALEAGRNVLVDGSLRDTDWYGEYFAKLRAQYPRLQIAILHVTAPRDAVFARAKERALRTGRVVPQELLVQAMEQVPRSVAILAPHVDYFGEINNAPGRDIELVTEGGDWDSFQSTWFQSLAFVVGREKKPFSTRRKFPSVRSEESCDCGEGNAATENASESSDEPSGSAAQAPDVSCPVPQALGEAEEAVSTRARRRWKTAGKMVAASFRLRHPQQPCCLSRSTCAIQSAPESGGFFGVYAEIRGEILETHGNYTNQRQWLQDAIVADLLRTAVLSSPSDTNASNPWLVLVAGAMGAGKRHTMCELAAVGRLRLGDFVFVDPEMIRQNLPEHDLIISSRPDCLEVRTNQEVRFLEELLVRAALHGGRSVVASLEVTDLASRRTLGRLREEFPALRVALLHVMADREAVLRRAAAVGSATGRTVVEAALEASLARAPRTAQALGPLVDYACELRNEDGSADGAVIATEGETWDTFSSRWSRPANG